MPSIANQVATIEHDLADALARVDALTAANEALATQNKAVLAENVTLSDKLTERQKLVDDTRVAADSLANAALHLLRTSRKTLDGGVLTPLKTPEEIAEHNKEILKDVTLANREEQVERISALAGVDETGVLAVIPPTRQSNSGDEQPDGVNTYALDQDAGNANAISNQDEEETPQPDGKRRQQAAMMHARASVGPTLVAHTDSEDPLPIFLDSNRAPQREAVFG